eukprot:COSAG06_NODE_4383_length_4313_cov_4.422164_1_plen_136_part_00
MNSQKFELVSIQYSCLTVPDQLRPEAMSAQACSSHSRLGVYHLQVRSGQVRSGQFTTFCRSCHRICLRSFCLHHRHFAKSRRPGGRTCCAPTVLCAQHPTTKPASLSACPEPVMIQPHPPNPMLGKKNPRMLCAP